MMNLDFLTASRYLKVYDWCNKNLPEINFIESLSPNQIKSKLWLVEELSKIPELNAKKLNIEIVGSWFGWPLVQMLTDTFEINRIDLIDIDPKANRVAYQYRELFEFHKNVIGIKTDNYWNTLNRSCGADLVINCSSEHMKETFADYTSFKKSCIFAIQSNNMFDEPTHINCVNSMDELVEKHRINSVLQKGFQRINGLQYEDNIERYMVIGTL